MNIMFVHQNMPGQYRELVQWLAEQGEHRIYFLTQRKERCEDRGGRDTYLQATPAPKKTLTV